MYNGIIVDDHNVSELSTGIIKLIRNPMYRDILGENARSSITGRFDWASLAERIELIYFKILKEKNGEDIPILPAEYEHKINKGYKLACYERRKNKDRQKKDRRVKQVKIDFIEQRKIE